MKTRVILSLLFLLSLGSVRAADLLSKPKVLVTKEVGRLTSSLWI